MFLEILQNSQENTCVRASFSLNLYSDTGGFIWVFQNFLRTPFLTEHFVGCFSKWKFWKQNRNCLAVFVHLIISFVKYFEMNCVLKFWNIFKFLFSNKNIIFKLKIYCDNARPPRLMLIEKHMWGNLFIIIFKLPNT